MLLTAEKIAKQAEDLEGLANIRAINKMYRDQDESHLWPISGKFNVTERAIRKARWLTRETGEKQTGLEYCYTLEMIMSEMVNNENNW